MGVFPLSSPESAMQNTRLWRDGKRPDGMRSNWVIGIARRTRRVRDAREGWITWYRKESMVTSSSSKILHLTIRLRGVELERASERLKASTSWRYSLWLLHTSLDGEIFIQDHNNGKSNATALQRWHTRVKTVGGLDGFGVVSQRFEGKQRRNTSQSRSSGSVSQGGAGWRGVRDRRDDTQEHMTYLA